MNCQIIILILIISCVYTYGYVFNTTFSGYVDLHVANFDIGPIPGNGFGRIYLSVQTTPKVSFNCKEMLLALPSRNTICLPEKDCLPIKINNYIKRPDESIMSDGEQTVIIYFLNNGKYNKNLIVADVNFGNMPTFNISLSGCSYGSEFNYIVDVVIDYSKLF